jgi:hypothetical protein
VVTAGRVIHALTISRGMSVCIPKSVLPPPILKPATRLKIFSWGFDADALSCRRSHIFVKHATRALLERESIISFLQAKDCHAVAIALHNAYQHGVMLAEKGHSESSL